VTPASATSRASTLGGIDIGDGTTTDFDALLEQALAGSTSTGGSPPSGLAGAGAALASALPANPKDAGFANGKIPTDALSTIGVGNHKLWAPAAEAFQRMTAAAKAQGVTIGVTDSYRSYDAQVAVAKKKGLYSQGGLAAKPGTSDHGWGLALDLDLNAKAQAWMRTNGSKFGFKEDTPREPWHWGYKG
jgi:LAS superfamily LD-carboxypeptidase LdcB